MANNRIAYGLAKEAGIDTTNMTPKEVWQALDKKGIAKYSGDLDNDFKSIDELKKEVAKELPSREQYNVKDVDKKEPKQYNDSGDEDYSNFALNDEESIGVYKRIKSGNYYTIEELQNLPVFQKIENEIAKVAEEVRQRLGASTTDTIGITTPEREKLRDEWVKQFLNSEDCKTIPSTGLKKGYKMTIVVGLPASGKSSRIANPLSEEQGAFILDNDEMKGLIDGYEKGKNANGVHLESKKLLKRAQDAFIDGNMKGTNVVMPVIGDDTESNMKKIQPFINAGYDVEIAYKQADTQVSLNRVLQRAIKEGRYIPQNTVLGYSNENILKAYNELVQMGIKKSKYSDM